MARRRSTDSITVGNRVQRAFGERLRRARRSSPRHCVQEDLASSLGVSRTSISNIERGRHRVFLDQVYIAAHALGLGVDALLPTLEEVFPEEPVSTAVDVVLAPNSVRAATEVVRAVVAQAMREQLAPSGAKKAAKRQKETRANATRNAGNKRSAESARGGEGPNGSGSD